MIRRIFCIAAAASLCSLAVSANMVVNGTFETGDLSGWTVEDYYPTAPPTVFTGQFVDGYPMLSHYAGSYSMGWQRHELNWAGTSGDSTKPCSFLRQSWTVDPGTYPVVVSGAFFLHHDREGEPEDDWGEGIDVRLYCDGQSEPQWVYGVWPREGDSFWIVKAPGEMHNDLEPGLDQITTTTGQVTLEIAWTTKWAVDLDTAAVDNIAVDLVGASKKSGPAADPPELYGPVAPAPATAKWSSQERHDTRVFTASYNHPVGLDPSDIATGDFDGDGHVDVVACCEWSHELALLMGRGDGDLAPAVLIPTGYNPRGIAVADFNSDGHLDMAVSCKGSAEFQVFLGIGDGSFQPPVSTSCGPGPWGICAGLFDGDAFPDIAVVSEIDDELQVFLGAGDGTFAQAGSYATGSMGCAVITDDFDNDGDADLATTCLWDADGTIYRGDGAGHFTFAFHICLDWQPVALASADLDGDGNVDLLVGHEHTSKVRVFMGNGDCTFTEPEDSSQGVHVAMDIGLGDFDGDGSLEAAVPGFSEKEVAVLYGFGGDPDFYQKRWYQCEDTPRSIAVADLDEDGRPDMIVGNGDSASVSVVTQSRMDWPMRRSRASAAGGWARSRR